MATRVNLPAGFELEETAAPQASGGAVNLPPGFELESDGGRAPVRIEGPRNPITGERPSYSEQDLARKFIPQVTKGLYESVPGGKGLLSLIQPEAAAFQAQIPAPQGIMGNMGRLAGEVSPDLALMTPFTSGAAALPAVRLPAMGGLSNLARLINNPLTRTAAGVGAYEGTKAAVQGQDPAEIAKRAGTGAGTALVAGKGFELAGKSAQGAIRGIGNTPAVFINSLVKPLLKDFSYGKNPGRTVASEGIVGNSLDELAVNISKRRQEIGDKIGKVLMAPANAGKMVDLTDALKPLEAAINEAKKYPKTNAGLIQRLQDTLEDLSARMQSVGAVSPAQATALKSEIGGITKWTGNASDDKAVNAALKSIYGNIKEKIGKLVPEVRALNEKYADLLSAEVATKYRDKIVSRQNVLSLAPKILGGGAAIAGLATGNPKLIAAALVEIGAERIMSSPALKTRVARVLAKLPADQLADVLEKSPALKKIPGVAAKLTGAAVTRKSG